MTNICHILARGGQPTREGGTLLRIVTVKKQRTKTEKELVAIRKRVPRLEQNPAVDGLVGIPAGVDPPHASFH